jgi:hypothetical protein
MDNFSPFPGMDPFLEEPVRWSGVHTRLINSISDHLADLVSPRFFVEIEERVHIILPAETVRWSIVPDVYLISGQEVDTETGTATAAPTIAPATLIEPLYEEEIRHRYIEIRDSDNRDVVTTIELLSPFNKEKGSKGQAAFLRKRRAVMSSKVHWLEIDLLRAGERPNEVAGKSDYYALLKRGDRIAPYEGWYFDLRDTLPTIAVPLRPPFADAPLQLQAVFNDMYRRAHYAESVDYNRPVPGPRLRPADEAWLRERLSRWLASRAAPGAADEPAERHE